MPSGLSHLRYEHQRRPTLIEVKCPKCNAKATATEPCYGEGYVIVGGGSCPHWERSEWSIACHLPSDVELLDAQGRRLKVARFEQRNEVIGVSVEVKVPEPDEERVSVISVKKDGDAWRVLAGDDVEKMVSEWEKSIEEFQGHMKKFAEAMLDQQKAKSPRKRKPQRQSRKR